jgi:undecaprenyl-diphosphatase
MTFPTAAGFVGDAGDFLLVNRFARRTGWLHGPMTFLANEGLILFVVLIVAGWLLGRRRGDAAAVAATAWAAIGTLIAVGVNQPVVSAAHERRPYASLPQVLVLVDRTTDFSFPSDHATMAGAVATGLLFVSKRLGILAWIAAALLAFSRVYVGAHYPHDVAVGLALGATVVLIGRLAAQPVLTALATRLADTPLRPLIIGRTTAA